MPKSTSESIAPLKVLPPLSSFELLDGSGTYLLQAAVRVSDGSKPELMATGVKELIHIRDMLKSVVDLKPGDRLAMDTRVKP
jgi:mediator of RNA polymerase II transcription subunit 18